MLAVDVMQPTIDEVQRTRRFRAIEAEMLMNTAQPHHQDGNAGQNQQQGAGGDHLGSLAELKAVPNE